ncbi:MAG: hypothetical protein PHU44_19265 [Syntrophales bacterium]|nr:hypothetical protein [Syntrophales bacterium]MDD5641199.1 hypothetical protein [Syntrophales bacterium]
MFQKDRRRTWRKLMAVIWTLPLVLASAPVQAANFTVDPSVTYNVNSNIAYDKEFVYGVINQGGFTNTVNNYLRLSGGGTYNLSGGNLSAYSQGIGYSMSGDGTFNQSGGSNTTNYLGVGIHYGSGTYDLSDGSLSANYERIGGEGNGTFNQSGGINHTTYLYLGDNGGRGTYNLSGGSLSAQFEVFDATRFGENNFTQSGGTNTTASLLLRGIYSSFFDYFSTSTYNLSGGSLIAGTIDLYTGGTFNQTGGSLNAAIFNQQGGTVTGVLENRGSFNFDFNTKPPGAGTIL